MSFEPTATPTRYRYALIACILASMLSMAALPAAAAPDSGGFDVAEDCPGVTLTLIPNSGEPGTQLAMQITGWPVDEDPPLQPITIKLRVIGNGEDLTLVQGPTNQADFTRYAAIPTFAAGDYTVEAVRWDSAWDEVVCATALLVIEGPPPTTTTAPPTTTTTAPPTTTTTVGATTTLVAVDETPEDDGSGSGSPWLIVLIVAVGVLAGAGFGWWFGRRRAPARHPLGDGDPSAPPASE